jgi:putative PIN family toxin of toxin-antitoxin system
VRVFLDTNVLVSAVATRGLANDVLRVVLTDHILVVGEPVLDELARVLDTKLKLPEQTIHGFLKLLRENEVAPRPTKAPNLPLKDRADRWVLGSAIEAEADIFVTGDRELLEVGDQVSIPILDPRGFWDLMREGRG